MGLQWKPQNRFGFPKMIEQTLEDKILDGFVHAFNESGPSFTLSEIASYLHISKKTIYTIFESKTDIYETLLRKTMKEIHDAQKKVFEDPNLNTREKLLKILTIRTSSEDRLDVSRLFTVEKAEPVFYQHLLKAYETQWDYFSDLVAIGKKDGTLKSDTSAPFLIGMIAKSYEMLYEGDFLARNHMTYTEAVVKIAKTVLSGVYAN